LSFESLKHQFGQLNIFPDSKFKLIEIGCGYGRITKLISSHYKNFEVVGFDNNVHSINLAKKDELKNPCRISYHIYDASVKIDPILTNFDISVSINVLQNCAETQEILFNFCKSHFDSLRPGGLCLILFGPSSKKFFEKQLELFRQNKLTGYSRIHKTYFFEKGINEIYDGVPYQSIFIGASSLDSQWYNYFWSTEAVFQALEQAGFIDIKFVPHLLTNNGMDEFDIESSKSFIQCYRPIELK